MRHPLWIANTILLTLCISALLFSFFSRQTIIDRVTISPDKNIRPVEEKTSEINIDKIYEYDLFDTYKKEAANPTKNSSADPIPEPPAPKPIAVPEDPKPVFLEPLPIVLKGIVFFYGDDSKNKAVIANLQTSKEFAYKVGDIIEDAQLIKIFNNKVLFLRPNGQQEVLYLRKKDAERDPEYANIIGWKNIAHQVDDFVYTINIREFIDRISNLGQFIDQLNLTTVYKQGASIGCRIGTTQENSLALELGLQAGDIILSINSIPATTAEKRLAIYKQIVSLKTKDVITVQLIRDGHEIIMTYSLENKIAETVTEKDTTPPGMPDKIKALEDRRTFAPTLNEIRTRERKNMMQKGQMSSNSLTSHFSE